MCRVTVEVDRQMTVAASSYSAFGAELTGSLTSVVRAALPDS
jgi:hypothetical protein